MVHIREHKLALNDMERVESICEKITLNDGEKLELKFKENEFKEYIISVTENSNVKIIDITNSPNIFKSVKVNVEKNSSLKYYQINLGSRFNETIVQLNENSKCEMKTSFFISNSKSYMINKNIHLNKNSISNMEIKGGTVNSGVGIIDGVVYINEKARNSEGHQKINCLILDDKSQIQAEPILEVNNNEVRCSHGCSIAQIKDEIKYFMKARGLDEKQITKMIVEGFFEEIVQEVPENKQKEIINNIKC